MATQRGLHEAIPCTYRYPKRVLVEWKTNDKRIRTSLKLSDALPLGVSKYNVDIYEPILKLLVVDHIILPETAHVFLKKYERPRRLA